MTDNVSTVLVTGAGGFVGSAVVRALVRAMRQGDEPPVFGDGRRVARVVGLLRSAADASRLADLAPGPEWTTIKADLGDPRTPAVLAQLRPRAVLHLALDSASHDPASETQLRMLVERPLTVLFGLLRGVPGAQIVTTGSAAVMTPGFSLDETSPTAPNPAYPHYAAAKLLEEELIERLGHENGVRWTHLRLFYLFGRYEEHSRLLPYLVRTLTRGEPARLSSGTQVRDYTDVDDAATAYLHALGAPSKLGDRKYLVGSGEGITVREFAEIVASVVGRPDLLHFGSTEAADLEGQAIVADVGRAREELGWSPPDPRRRLRRAAEWWLKREREAAVALARRQATNEE